MTFRPIARSVKELREHIYSNCIKSESGCLEWQGSTMGNGYPQINWKHKHWLGNRLIWFLEKGYRSKLCILHKCDNRLCVNIDHLYEGTKKDNARDTVNRNRHHQLLKTHCKHGHEYTVENIVRTKTGRDCRACIKKRQKQYASEKVEGGES